MIYSVWADGERIGETRLELQPSPRRRTGAFLPTEAGLALLRTGIECRLEVRDSAGNAIGSDSIAITDVQRMIAAARARRPAAVCEASAAVCGPIKFVISLTMAAGDRDARVSRGRPALLGSEHLGPQRSQPPAD